MRILGIDPGLRRTGFGVIQTRASALHYIASGTIIVPADLPLAQRLKAIFDNLREIIQTREPDACAIEKVFVNTNASSTLMLGQARGVALCALASGADGDENRPLPVYEYTALQIKKAVVGHGHADKRQVQVMVQRLLNLSALPAADSADALACAICHAHVSPLLNRLSSGLGTLPASTRLPLRTSGARLRGGRVRKF